MNPPPVIPPPSPRLSRTSRCSITELTPAFTDPASKSIDGVVSLLWPYSSSTRRTSLLLADLDSRVRKAKGQTKITFCGRSAVAVAESHLGIGDTIYLSLEGARFKEAGYDVPNLGKRADCDLEFEDEVLLEVYRGSIPLAVIDTSRTPELTGRSSDKVDVNGGFEKTASSKNKVQESWSSPAFAKQISLALIPPFETASDSFPEGDGYLPGRARKRARFSRDSGSWRLLERSSSSEQDEELAPLTPKEPSPAQVSRADPEVFAPSNVLVTNVEAFHQPEVQTTTRLDEDLEVCDEGPPGFSVPPSPLPSIQEQHLEDSFATTSAQEVHDGFGLAEMEPTKPGPTATPQRATTPRLLSQNSQGLQTISPFVKEDESSAEHFAPVESSRFELESNAEPPPVPLRNILGSDEAPPSAFNTAITTHTADEMGSGAIEATAIRSRGEMIDLTLLVEEQWSEEEMDQVTLRSSPKYSTVTRIDGVDDTQEMSFARELARADFGDTELYPVLSEASFAPRQDAPWTGGLKTPVQAFDDVQSLTDERSRLQTAEVIELESDDDAPAEKSLSYTEAPNAEPDTMADARKDPGDRQRHRA